MDESLLRSSAAELESFRAWAPGLVRKLAETLRSADEAALVRMNPLTFAREEGCSTLEAIDLFLHAARLGIVTMDWHLLCPACGAAVQSFDSLRKLRDSFFCVMCQLESAARFDEYISVSFTVAPRLRHIRFHDMESLSIEDFLFRLWMSREAHFPDLEGPRFVDCLARCVKALAWLAPGETARFSFDIDAGRMGACEYRAHTGLDVSVEPGAAASSVELTLSDTAMAASPTTVAPGRVEVSVANRRAARMPFVILHKPTMTEDARMRVVLEPFLTGAMLLTNQTFRRLFRGETIQSSEGIGVRDVTFLFTDLKGSTALYQQIGDMRAFSLVQRHFERLAAVVQAHPARS